MSGVHDASAGKSRRGFDTSRSSLSQAERMNVDSPARNTATPVPCSGRREGIFSARGPPCGVPPLGSPGWGPPIGAPWLGSPGCDLQTAGRWKVRFSCFARGSLFSNETALPITPAWVPRVGSPLWGPPSSLTSCSGRLLFCGPALLSIYLQSQAHLPADFQHKSSLVDRGLLVCCRSLHCVSVSLLFFKGIACRGCTMPVLENHDAGSTPHTPAYLKPNV